MQTGQPVFIIDDDESVRTALRRLLRAVGRSVETFATAEEFLGSAPQQQSGCIVIDVHLPGLGGLELQQRLTAGGCGVPVIFISGYMDERVRALALQAGAIAFLHKPFEDQALLDAVAQALS